MNQSIIESLDFITQPAGLMEKHDFAIEQRGQRLFVAYLAEEDDRGEKPSVRGRIYTGSCADAVGCDEADAINVVLKDDGVLSWSISGEQHRNGWNPPVQTGTWVPDEVALEAIDTRQGVYAFGYIQLQNRVWKVFCDDRNNNVPSFSTWDRAFEWLEAVSERHEATDQQLVIGRSRARYELCRDDLIAWNEWYAQERFGIVVAEYRNLGTVAIPEWDQIDSMVYWGFHASCAIKAFPDMLR